MGTSAFDKLFEQAPEPRKRTAFEALFEDEEQGRRQEAARVRSLVNGVQHSPDQAAEAATISRRTGVPADVALRNLNPLRDMVSVAEFDADTFVRDYPVTSRWLQGDPIRPALAKDDFESLTGLERITGSGTVADRFLQGFANLGMPASRQTDFTQKVPTQRGTIAASFATGRGQIEESVLYGQFRAEERRNPAVQARIAAARARQVELPEPTGLFEESLRSAVSGFLPSMLFVSGAALEGAAVGGVTGAALGAIGGPVGATGMAGIGASAGAKIEGYNAYRLLMTGELAKSLEEARDANGQPIPDEIQDRVAVAGGAGLALLGMYGFDKLVGILGRGSQQVASRIIANGVAKSLTTRTAARVGLDVARVYGASVLFETAQEVTEQAGLIAAESVARQVANAQGMEFDPVDNVLAELGETAVQTFLGALWFGGVGAVGAGAVGMARVQKATEDGAQLAEAIGIADASKFRQRDPEAFESVVAEQVKASGKENLSVDGERLQILLQEQGVPLESFAQAMGLDARDFASRIAQGGDVMLPTAKVLARLTGTDLITPMADILKWRPDGLAPVEARELAATIEKEGAAIAKELEAEIEIAKGSPEERVLAAFTAQLTAATEGLPKSAQFTPENLEAQAMLYTKMYSIAARMEGKGRDAFQLYQETAPRFLDRTIAEPLYNAMLEARKLEKSGKKPERLAELRATIATLSGRLTGAEIAQLEQRAFHASPTSGITAFDRLAPRGLSSKPNRMDSVGSWFSLNEGDTKPFLAGWDWTRNQMVPSEQGTLYEVDLDYSNPKTYPTFQALMDDFNVAVGRDWKNMDPDTRGAEGIFPDGGNIFNAYLKAQGYDAIVVEQQGGIDQAVESQSYIAVLSPETQVTITHRNGEPVTAQERTDFLAQMPSKPALPPYTENVPVAQLSQYREFLREPSKELVEDIRQNGIREPLLLEYSVADHAVRLTEGNNRVAAAEAIGLTEVPVSVVRREGSFPKRAGANAPVPLSGPRPTQRLPEQFAPSAMLSGSADFLAQEQTPDVLFQSTTGDLGTMNVTRGTRVTADNVVLSEAEEQAVDQMVKDIKRLHPKLRPVVKKDEVAKYVREVKAAFPESDGWAPLEFKGLDAAQTNKNDNGKVEYKWGNVAYTFNRAINATQGLKEGTPEYEAQVTATATALADEVRSVVARAKAGDVAAKRIIAQRGWYKNMRQRLRQEFGGLGDVFADLLGALSPNTPVRDNWKNAVDFLRRATEGAFDELIPQWEAWAAKVAQEEVAFKAWFDQQLLERGVSAAKLRETPEWKARKAEMSATRELPDALIPTKANGKKYGFNGKNAVRATLALWRVVRESDVNIGRGGQAPKALNFSGNLIGFRAKATIDVWAARMLQRLTGRVRIPPPSETSVGGEMRPDGSTTGAFGHGQEVFARAAEMIRNDESLGMPEMGDDDLQAVVWFIEKELWTKNNWTSAAGEGGSFEFEADLQGVADVERVDALRRVMDSSKSTTQEREDAAAELTKLARTVDRYTVGLSIQQSGGIQGVDVIPTDDAQSVVLQGLRAAIYATANPDAVLATKAVSTEGRYFGDSERAFDVEAVVREGFDPTPLWREIVRVAQANNQDSAFLSRVLRAEETMDPMRHRPGIELYLSTTDTAVLEERIAAITAMLAEQDINGFTITMDGRATGAVEGQPGRPIGVRLQYVPEFDRRYSEEAQALTPDQMVAKLQERGAVMKDLADRLMAEVPDVSFAGEFYYETRVAFSHQYAEELADAGDDTAGSLEGVAGGAARGWEGRPLREGIAATDRQLGIARADAERQAQSRDPARRDAARTQEVDILQQGANAFIIPGVSQRTIGLMPTANLSSVLHEMAHDFLFLYRDLSSAPDASPEIKAFYAEMLAALDVQDGVLTEAAQEKFARGFERHAQDGKAPSRALARAYVRFRAWMTRIYRMMTEQLVPISPELRDVFDRMIATEEELAEVRGEIGSEPMFSEAEAELLGEEAVARYQAKVELRTAEEQGTLLKRLLAERSDEYRKLKRERESVIRAEVESEVAERPVYQALRSVTGTDAPKLDLADLELQFGDGVRSTLPRAITASEGNLIPVDALALQFGFRDGTALVAQLQDARVNTEKREVSRIVAERMREEFPDPMESSVVMRDEAMKAAHVGETDDVLLDELKFLGKLAGIRPRGNQAVTLEAVRQVARDTMAKERVRDIRPIVYANAEARAATKSGQAMKKGDYATAEKYKRQQMVQHILYREAVKAVEQVQVIARYARKLEKGASQERIGKAGGPYLDAINAVLDAYEFRYVTGPRLDRRASLLAFIDRSTTESGIVPAIPPTVLEDARAVNYRELPMGTLVDVYDTLRQVEHLAALKGKLLKAAKYREIEAAETAMVETIEKYHDIEVRPPDYAPTRFKKLVQSVKKWDAWHVKPEFLFRWLDGEEAFGANHTVLFQPIADAQNAEARMLKAAVPEIQRLFAIIPKDVRKTYDTKLTGPDIPVGYTKEQAVALALNWGNQSNREAVAEGFLDENRTTPHLTPRQIQALLRTLTKAEWDFVQGVWDYIDSFWPEIADLQKRLVGVAPEKIGADAFTQVTADGQTIALRGGYYPLAYDRDYSWSQRKVEAKQAVQEMSDGGFARKVTKHGHTEERVGSGGKPVSLKLSIFPQHIVNVVHDLTHREAVIDVRRMSERPAVRAAIVGSAGRELYDSINPWLNRVAADQSPPASPMEDMLGRARVGATMVNMGFKVTTAIVQPLGYLQSVDLIGVKYARRGMAAFLKSPKAIWEQVKEWSPELESRQTQFDRDVKDAVDRLGDEGWAPDVMKAAFYMTGLLDMSVAVPTFYGAYLKSMEVLDPGNHDAAVAYAESVVRQSQSSGAAKDLAMIQGGPESRRMFTMFYSYFSVLYNLFRRSGGMLAQKGVTDLPRFAGSMALLWFLPSVLSELVAQRGPEDDEDELNWLLEQIARYPFASVVGVRDFTGGIANYLTQGRLFYDISPVVSAVEAPIRAVGGALQALGGEPMSRAEVKSAVEAAGYWGRLPSRQMWITGEALYDWMMGFDAPEGPVDAARDLAFPRPR